MKLVDRLALSGPRADCNGRHSQPVSVGNGCSDLLDDPMEQAVSINQGKEHLANRLEGINDSLVMVSSKENEMKKKEKVSKEVVYTGEYPVGALKANFQLQQSTEWQILNMPIMV
jgi:hypothetical protein